MFASVKSLGVSGVGGYGVTVEVNIASGLPGFDMVGLPDTAVRESRDRVYAALRNNGFAVPTGRVTVSLSPADVRKEGAAFDLSIAMALISSLKDTPVDEKAVVFGEIGLAGEIRSVSQAQMRVNEAVRLGFDRIILPFHNLKGVSCEDAELIGVKNIREAYEAIIK